MASEKFDKKEEMSGFKLLAIVPLEGCHSDIRKNLEEGFVYKFYNNYTIETSSDSTGVNYVVKNNKSIDLYKVTNLDLNIHAVVGENGSGKSSLFELYYYFVYLYGCLNNLKNKKSNILTIENQDLKYKHYIIKKHQNKLEKYINDNKNKEISKEILTEISDISKTHNIGTEIIGNDFNLNFFYIQLIQKEKEYEATLNKQKEAFDLIKSKVSCSIIYEVDNCIYDFTYRNNEFTLYQFGKKGNKKTIDNFELEKYFYTVSLNYSHHSLNSLTIGQWINSLFHKNDAYITPVVINPMRIKGNFDINDEIHLSKERIMMNIIPNLITDEQFKILDRYSVKKVVYKLKEGISPIKDFVFQNINEQFEQILALPWQLKNQKEEYSLVEYAIGYLQSKIQKLKSQYGIIFFNNEKDPENTEELDKELVEITKKLVLSDHSHITKKIDQTINFIKHFDPDIWNFEKDEDNNIKVDFTIEDLKKWMTTCNKNYMKEDSFNLSVLAHPGIFNVDFILKDEKGAELRFEQLSSGEQQLIFNTNTIIYHINNLNSAHNSIAKEEISRPRYTSLNILLDEIELYYHPEYQRKFVNTLINELDRFSKGMNKDDGIKSINLCFLTHSPFILSDIPANNVLRLQNGKPELIKNESNTFGANIHDLLANDFFLENGFMGEFAKTKIQETIMYLNFHINHNEQKRIEVIEESKRKEFEKLKLTAIISENKYIAEKLSIKIDKKDYYKAIIDSIGEKLIQNKLTEMYSIAFKTKKDV